MIDINSDSINDDYLILKKELLNHKPDLDKLPKMLLLTKIDTISQDDLAQKKLPKDIEIIKISSITGKNLENAIKSIAYLVES